MSVKDAGRWNDDEEPDRQVGNEVEGAARSEVINGQNETRTNIIDN